MPLGQTVIPQGPSDSEVIDPGLDWQLGCLVFCFALSLSIKLFMST